MNFYSEIRISQRSGDESKADTLPITADSLPYILIPNTCQYVGRVYVGVCACCLCVTLVYLRVGENGGM